MSTPLMAALASARFIQFAAAMTALGTALFPFYTMPLRPAGAIDIATTMTKPARLVLISAGLTAALATLAWATATITGVTGNLAGIADPDTLSAFFFGTSFGSAWLLRLVMAALLAAAVL